jgi:hypothetical protein
VHARFCVFISIASLTARSGVVVLDSLIRVNEVASLLVVEIATGPFDPVDRSCLIRVNEVCTYVYGVIKPLS